MATASSPSSLNTLQRIPSYQNIIEDYDMFAKMDSMKKKSDRENLASKLENQRLKIKLNIETVTNETYQMEIKRLNSIIQQNKSQSKEYDQEINGLKKQVAELTNQAKSQNKENIRLAEFETKWNQLSDMEKEGFNLIQEIREAKGHDKLKQYLMSKWNDKNDFENKIDVFLKMIVIQQKRIREFSVKESEQLNDLIKKLEVQTKNSNFYTHKCNENEKKIVELNMSLKQMKEQSEFAISVHDRLNAELDKFKIYKSPDYVKALKEFYSQLNTLLKSVETITKFCFDNQKMNKIDNSNFSSQEFDNKKFELADSSFLADLYSIDNFLCKIKVFKDINIRLISIKSKIGLINLNDFVDSPS